MLKATSYPLYIPYNFKQLNWNHIYVHARDFCIYYDYDFLGLLGFIKFKNLYSLTSHLVLESYLMVDTPKKSRYKIIWIRLKLWKWWVSKFSMLVKMDLSFHITYSLWHLQNIKWRMCVITVTCEWRMFDVWN